MAKRLLVSLLLVALGSGTVVAMATDQGFSRGMVVSSSEEASQVGQDILKNGGNAVDAAVAVGFA
jgi:gamma-glutamyltranspeptidase/glutathione hydrolase